MNVVYILLCANGEYYVGSTTNLAIRLKEHSSVDGGFFRGAKFTKARKELPSINLLSK